MSLDQYQQALVDTGAEVYLVGGAVRDRIMHLPINDRDYVIVGSDRDTLISLGFKQVGKDYPVFLHPDTKDEYALARRESWRNDEWVMSTDGVSLEEDLGRRDLKMNAIAQDIVNGNIFDYYGGRLDIQNKVLNPVSDKFKEDPLRVLRAARFLATYPQMEPSDELIKVCRTVICSMEIETRVKPERIWREIKKVLNTKAPWRFFEFLMHVGWSGIPRPIWDMLITTENPEHHPEANVWEHTKLVMEEVVKGGYNDQVMLAAIVHDFGKPHMYRHWGNGHGHESQSVIAAEGWFDTLGIPNKYKLPALAVAAQHTKIHTLLGTASCGLVKPKSIFKIFEQTDMLNKPWLLELICQACIADSKGRGVETADEEKKSREHFYNREYECADYLTECYYAAAGVDTKSVANEAMKRGKKGEAIGNEIRAARINAIRKVYNKWKAK